MKPLIDKAVDASISSASNSAPNSAIFSASNSALEEAEERYAGRLILTPKATLGLFFIQRYRYLTITQFARITAMHYSRAADKLHSIGFSGGQLSSYGKGSSALDIPLIDNARSQDQPENNVSNINGLKFYH